MKKAAQPRETRRGQLTWDIGRELPSEYDPAVIRDEVLEVLKELGLDQKQFAAQAGVDYKAFNRAFKESEQRDFLSVRDLGMIAAFANARLKERLPTGWPIVTREAHRELIRSIATILDAQKKPSR